MHAVQRLESATVHNRVLIFFTGTRRGLHTETVERCILSIVAMITSIPFAHAPVQDFITSGDEQLGKVVKTRRGRMAQHSL